MLAKQLLLDCTSTSVLQLLFTPNFGTTWECCRAIPRLPGDLSYQHLHLAYFMPGSTAQVRWIIKINIQCCVSGNIIFLHVLEIHYDDYKPESDDIKLRPLRFTHNHRHGYHWEIRYVCKNWLRKVIELLIGTRPSAATKQYWIFDPVKFCHSFFGAPQCFWILPHCVWYITCNEIYRPWPYQTNHVSSQYVGLPYLRISILKKFRVP